LAGTAGAYQSGKRKVKALPSNALAEHYRQIKYVQLNSDVFTGTVTADWNQMRNEYEHSKKVAGIVEDSLYEVALTLRYFERLTGKCSSKQLIQNTIDKYILERGKEVVRSTVNKDIRNLDWMISNSMICERPLVLCLLRTVYPQLFHRNCWNILHQI